MNFKDWMMHSDKIQKWKPCHCPVSGESCAEPLNLWENGSLAWFSVSCLSYVLKLHSVRGCKVCPLAQSVPKLQLTRRNPSQSLRGCSEHCYPEGRRKDGGMQWGKEREGSGTQCSSAGRVQKRPVDGLGCQADLWCLFCLSCFQWMWIR